MKADAVIIGGGASGTLCAGLAAGRGLSVVLLEPNRMLGRKLRITGKGRCNVTNDCDAREFISAIPGDGRFLQSAIHRFGTSDTKALFEGLGVALKTERGNRVFPESDKADDIADALAELARKNGVRVLRERARHILTDESGAVCAVATERGEIECANAVICTGGLSYPGTGSTGDGYRMAQELGHTIRTCRPSLVPLESPDKWCREMQGFSLRNVELYAYEDDKLIYKALGEMLFTHFGVSGPLVLSASAHMRRFGECKYRLSIDLKPGLDDKKLDARLLRDFEKYNNREFRNSLGDLAGRMMIPVLVELSGIPGDTRTNSVTKQQRAALASLLKHFPVAISGPRPIAEAIVTSGGVATTEVNPRTMESKLVPLESPDKWCREMQGFSLRNVELYAYEDDKLIYKALGEMLFTHFGVSGPLVLSASAHMRRFGECKYRLSIDLKPGLDDKKLDARLLRDFEKYNNREFRNSLGDLAGRMMIPVLVELSGIPGDTRTNSVTKQQRAALASLLKHFPVAISGPRPIAEAIVTSGGVATTEVNPRTMESKLVPGLHFAGEVLDLDAYTGGYNLQIAWSTAFVAANSLHQGCEDG